MDINEIFNKFIIGDKNKEASKAYKTPDSNLKDVSIFNQTKGVRGSKGANGAPGEPGVPDTGAKAESRSFGSRSGTVKKGGFFDKMKDFFAGIFNKNKKTGITGENGKDGKPGELGRPGPVGKDGKDGKDGKPGELGRPGADGKKGATGEAPLVTGAPEEPLARD